MVFAVRMLVGAYLFSRAIFVFEFSTAILLLLVVVDYSFPLVVIDYYSNSH